MLSCEMPATGTAIQKRPWRILSYMHENVTYWRDDAFSGFETCMVRQSYHSFPNHVHDTFYAVGLMEIGASYSLGPGREDGLVAEGQIALINPGQVHSGVPASDSPITYRMLYLDVALVRTAVGDLHARHRHLPEFTTVVINDPTLRQKLHRVSTCMATQTGHLEKESLLFDALSQLLASCAGVKTAEKLSMGHPQAVRRAKEYLAANLDQKITLQDLARTVGLSRYHLLRTFKRHTGLPPHLYRTQRRIDLAKTLLRKGMPFAQVALEAGFVDQSHFTNKFKQFTAATPSQYLHAGAV